MTDFPSTLPFSSIIRGTRGRKTYNRIDELAESIEHNGLIDPIVLDPSFNLVTGGRRSYALELLGVTELHYGVTSHPEGWYCPIHGRAEGQCCDLGVFSPLKCGFLIKLGANEVTNILHEIAENLDREDLDWREEVTLIVKAWKLAESQAHINSERILMRDFGSSLKVGYTNLSNALYVYDDLKANPERYKDTVSIRGAFSVLLKVNATAMAKLAAEKSISEVTPLLANHTPVALPEVRPAFEPRLSPELGELTQSVAKIEVEIEHPTIPLSTSFLNIDALAFMEQCEPNLFDHCVTDPDYALDTDLLASGTGTTPGLMQTGVAQTSVTQSLQNLRDFLRLSFKVVKPFGFCVFWYDISHHEKLLGYAKEAGWIPQEWPLTWRKLDYRSNASPAHNTCKNVEWAMICRKPNAVLAKAQMTSIYDTMTKKVTKELGHPFAKPYDLWKWILAMVAIKGQVIFDPFAGSGSLPIAALQFGMRPVGCEVNPDHYHNLMCNLQVHYKKQLGPDIKFS